MMQLKELNDILNECKRFAKKEIRDPGPGADLNPSPEVRQAVWNKSAELDLPALLLPEVYGGAGYPALCGAMVVDAFSSACAGFASVFAHHFAACIPLAVRPVERCENFTPRIAGMEGCGAFPAAVIFPHGEGNNEVCLTEAENGLVLTGTTQPAGNLNGKGYICIFAGDTVRENGITCLFLEQERLQNACGENIKLPGLKINPFHTLRFQDIPVSKDDIIGDRGESHTLMQETRKAFFGFIAAMAIGATRSAYQKAFSYAGQRYQYGDLIIRHQEIQRMLGAMLMKLQLGTAGYTRLFATERLNLPFSVPDPGLTKSFCADMALEIILDAIQIHGGYGYMHEYGLEKIMRDVKVLQLIGGSSPRHHIEAIADQL